MRIASPNTRWANNLQGLREPASAIKARGYEHQTYAV